MNNNSNDNTEGKSSKTLKQLWRAHAQMCTHIRCAHAPTHTHTQHCSQTVYSLWLLSVVHGNLCIFNADWILLLLLLLLLLVVVVVCVCVCLCVCVCVCVCACVRVFQCLSYAWMNLFFLFFLNINCFDSTSTWSFRTKFCQARILFTNICRSILPVFQIIFVSVINWVSSAQHKKEANRKKRKKEKKKEKNPTP